ncbi:hypothetical protein PM082_023242 [Marasmius tenuissimus]|nr:hypothetical protein PM082_023242 [Marasmius tenuissimus]
MEHRNARQPRQLKDEFVQTSTAAEEDVSLLCSECGFDSNEECSPSIDTRVFRQRDILHNTFNAEANRSWITVDEAAIMKLDCRIEELRRKLEELENRQEMIAVNVERRYSCAAPIWRLPPELLGRIFNMACLPEGSDEGPGRSSERWGLSDCTPHRIAYEPIVMTYGRKENRPGALEAVCWYWWQVAMNDPALWSRITVELGSLCVQEANALLRALRRGHAHKRIIRLVGADHWGGWVTSELRSELGGELGEVLAEYTEILTCPIGNLDGYGLDCAPYFRSLKSLKLDHHSGRYGTPSLDYLGHIRRVMLSPQLVHLEVDHVVAMGEDRFYGLKTFKISRQVSKADFLRVVKGCPNLVSLAFDIEDWNESIAGDRLNTPVTVLNQLTSLLASYSGMNEPPSSLFLEYISAPVLQELALPFSRHPAAITSVLSFLHRSQCSPQTMYIPCPLTSDPDVSATREAGGLYDLFAKTPQTESLCVTMRRWRHWGEDKASEDMWKILKRGTVLPDLQSLTIHVGRWADEQLPFGTENQTTHTFLDMVESWVLPLAEKRGRLHSAWLLLALEHSWSQNPSTWSPGAKINERRLELLNLGLESVEVRGQLETWGRVREGLETWGSQS